MTDAGREIVSTPSTTLSPFVRGALLLLLAMFLFDVMGAIIKYLGTLTTERADIAYPAQQLAVFRNIFGLVPCFAVLFASRDWHAAGRPLIIRQWKLGLGRGLMIAFAQFCYYTALVHLAFATATTLSFAGPLFITALSMPVLGLRVGPWRWLAVVVGFVGVILIMRPGSDVFTYAALLPIGAALGYAGSSIAIRLMDEDVPSATVNLYSTTGALAGSLVAVLGTGGWVPVASAQDWFWLAAMGAAGGFAVLCLIAAYRLSEPGNLAPFEYFGIPFSFVIGWYVFHEAPFDRLFPGALLIVAGGLLIVWRQRVNEQRQKTAAGQVAS